MIIQGIPKKSWWEEARDQALHVVMGGAVAGLVGWGLSYVMPLWVALPVGALVSRVTWMIREASQKNWKFIVWWNKDLAFIDGGIVIGIAILIGVNTWIS